jgi:DNA-binding transcriptional ArsR family regulator
MMTTRTTQSNLDRTLTALADPTRRAILERLSKGESRVTELAQPFTMSLNAVSKHIRILERAHLVRRRCAGREHFLSLNREPLDEAAAWIEAQRAIWTARLDNLAALLQDKEEQDEGPRAEDRRKTPIRKTPKKKGRSR